MFRFLVCPPFSEYRHSDTGHRDTDITPVSTAAGGAMHGRKKSDLPQTKEEKDAVQAKISNYKKASGFCVEAMLDVFCSRIATNSRCGQTAPSCSRVDHTVSSPCCCSASPACFIGGVTLGGLSFGS